MYNRKKFGMEGKKVNKEELLKIKQKALEEHIPIIMDDTLEVIAKILTEKKPEKILEIGTAVGYSAICFSEYLKENAMKDTDFYQKALDRVESAIHILQKIEGAGYSHEPAEEISKRIVLFALKSADDTNDK